LPRIFAAVASSPNAPQLPWSRIWHVNLIQPLIELGHEVIEFDFDWSRTMLHLDPSNPIDSEFISRQRPKTSEQLLEQVARAHAERPLDLFFSYFYSANVLPETIREISRMGIPTVNWYCNGSYQMDLVEDIAPAFDYCLVPEKFRLDDYRRLGARPIYCQEAAHPGVYQPHDLPRDYDVTFVGQAYGTRIGFISSLIQHDIPTRVWGPGWLEQSSNYPQWRRTAGQLKRRLLGQPEPEIIEHVPRQYCGPPLSDDDLVKMYSRSKISLGFSSVARIAEDPSAQIRQVRLRDFEATMSGAFYLVEQFDELEEFFTPDREIVTFRDHRELVEKAKYYLQHDAEREKIRQAGMTRARAEHTWHERFKMVFREMGLSG